MFQSRMRRKGKKCSEPGKEHTRLFHKRGTYDGKPPRWKWLHEKRIRNLIRLVS